MDATDIVGRMKDYFLRQIACYEETIGAYSSLDFAAPEPALHEALARQAAFTARANELEAELMALLPEWNAAVNLVPSRREEIRELAAKAEGLALQIVELNDDALQQINERMEQVRADIGTVKRGRAVTRGYRAGDEKTSRVDRQA